MIRVGITGHRPNKLWNDYRLVTPQMMEVKLMLIDIVRTIAPDELVTGMALGIDTLFAQIAIELHIPFIAAIPDMAQADRWPKESQSIYYRLLDKAKEVVNVSKSSVFKMEHLQQRNIWMVDNTVDYIAVWNGDNHGGTYNCVQYLIQQNRTFLHLNPFTLELKRYDISSPHQKEQV